MFMIFVLDYRKIYFSFSLKTVLDFLFFLTNTLEKREKVIAD